MNGGLSSRGLARGYARGRAAVRHINRQREEEMKANITKRLKADQVQFVSWNTSSLPDSEMTVLVRVEDEAYPVWPGFHDGTTWRMVSGDTFDRLVLGWMDLELAAQRLDVAKDERLEAIKS